MDVKKAAIMTLRYLFFIIFLGVIGFSLYFLGVSKKKYFASREIKKEFLLNETT